MLQISNNTFSSWSPVALSGADPAGRALEAIGAICRAESTSFPLRAAKLIAPDSRSREAILVHQHRSNQQAGFFHGKFDPLRKVWFTFTLSVERHNYERSGGGKIMRIRFDGTPEQAVNEDLVDNRDRHSDCEPPQCGLQAIAPAEAFVIVKLFAGSARGNQNVGIRSPGLCWPITPVATHLMTPMRPRPVVAL